MPRLKLCKDILELVTEASDIPSQYEYKNQETKLNVSPNILYLFVLIPKLDEIFDER